ncbi:caspase family protein [Streptomyces sp. ID03-2B]|uniref:effector-associated domain 2-containing protein n=1 Tax=Streptomyces sp. ID03-2B TaxID=3028660 RepID=UPI0029A09AC2|nr:caspase family protein [Streptomyces sp. ID03-2B]MDX3596021.1 caspase family protein [Streptomyces sp. ID03-2B]
MSAGPAHSAGLSAPTVDPARVVALVVGVEAYAAGPGWTLPGPVRDALRFRDWLRSTGVPDANILLHLAPAQCPDTVTGHRGADHETLRRALVHELPARQGDVLWIWWGGHGVLDRDEHLRLYCADATEADRRNIDLESARRRLSSDVLPGFERQNWVVDACQTFEERHRPAVTIPDGSLPAGQRLRIHRQSVLLAADRGQRAANDPVRGQGVFSDILLRELATLPGGPAPDPEALFAAVRGRFDRLRAEGGHTQLPTLQLHRPGHAEHLPAPPAPRNGEAPGRDRAGGGLVRVVEALLAYPLMSDRDERQTMVAELDPVLVARMPRHAVPRTDILGILRTLRRRPEGPWDLYRAVTLLDDDPDRAAELEQALREFQDEDRPGT